MGASASTLKDGATQLVSRAEYSVRRVPPLLTGYSTSPTPAAGPAQPMATRSVRKRMRAAQNSISMSTTASITSCSPDDCDTQSLRLQDTTHDQVKVRPHWSLEASQPFKKCTDAGNTTIDANALVDLFFATRGRTWIVNDHWLVMNSTVSICNWTGIGCDACGRVSRISLSQNNVSGTLPVSLRDLAALEVVDFSRNPSLSGALEPEFSRWTAVTLVDFSFTSLQGECTSP
jgi:hypothetical protein